MILVSPAAFKVFLEESGKHLEELELTIHSKDLTNTDALRAASCRFHTIKGGAGFFGLNTIAKVAGELETLLLEASIDMKADTGGVDLLFERLKLEIESLNNHLPKDEGKGAPSR